MACCSAGISGKMNRLRRAHILGNEPDGIFPEKIGDINIIGIADRKEKTPENYKKIRLVQIPKTYESIGKNAFRGCMALKEALFVMGNTQMTGYAESMIAHLPTALL